MYSRFKSLGALLVSLSVVACPAWADQLSDIKSKGTLVCGVLGTFEPFGYTDIASRATVGYDVDVCHAVARQLGVKAEIKPVSIEARIPELQQGRMDLLAAGLGYSPQRAKQVDFSDQYFISPHRLIVKASRGYSQPSDLEGKRVSFTKGGITEGFVRSAVQGAKLTGFEDTTTAFTALAQNKVVGFSVAEIVARRLISKTGASASEYTILEPAVGSEKWGLGVRKGEGALLAAVNDALRKMEASGEAQQIFDKWLGAETMYDMTREFKIAPIQN
ncbi:ABC transporter substrate-binding protein [Stutzerimonas chloritidismutans]|uniref:ABC transporter substrate-binding protein n=1 Tax=Stutzerimonas chloritidismutans TaxID=203192 RepID=UPI003F16DE8B